MNKRIIFKGLLFIALILPSIWPLFRGDFFRMHDYTHVARLVEMDKAIKDGHFPPRWAEDLGWGYGMPLFNFYAPLPYYLGEIFYLLGFSFLNSIKIVFGLTAFLAFLGMYLLARKFWGKSGGFLAALAFVYSPYRAVDFYVRGALGELFAISLIPWVLWGITQAIEKTSKLKIAIGSLILGLFLLSHTVLNLICLPCFLLFAIFYYFCNSNRKSKKGFLGLILVFVLGLGLASYFLLPAFFEKDLAQVGKLIGGYSHYSHHFLYFRQFFGGQWGYGGSVDGPNDGLSFHLGKVHLFLAFLTFCGALIWSGLREKFKPRELIVFFFALLGSILAFLSTYKAKFIWDAIPVMAFIQFPWRLNSFIIVLVAFLCGGGCFYLNKTGKKGISGLFLLVFIGLILKINLRYFEPQVYVNPSDFYYTEEEQIRQKMSGVIPDYTPQSVKEDPKEIAVEGFKLLEGDAEVEVKEDKTQKLSLNIKADEDFVIQLNRFYFPGWKLFQDGKVIGFNYKDHNGIIKASLPPGEYELNLVFKNTPIRTIANFISLFSLGLIFVFLGKREKK